MARTNQRTPRTKVEPLPVESPRPVAASVLVAAPSPQRVEEVASALHGSRVLRAGSPDEIRAILRETAVDAAFIACDAGDPAALALIEQTVGRAAVVALAQRPTLEHATGLMRLGAADLVALPATPHDLRERLAEALERTRRSRLLEARVERLRLVCRRLNEARRQVSSQVGTLCNDLVEAYQELSDKVTHMNVATEFSSLIRHELDVESLLRTALEFVLAKTGPTNAAVYLPATSGDYSLGAYVNFDGPKDSADILLEQMAGVVAPRIERESGVCFLKQGRDMAEFLGSDAQWIGDAGGVAFPCRHEGECLAVVILFRDRRTPLSEDLRPVFQTISELFGRQLARVIHIHHRHLPKDQWGGFAGPDDDIDLAA
ncbi:MAG: hypothetical protein IT437_08970 [Phycisphaerales bacterium]|nr:hypothetical protein [Phycisphaerales bacterium]